MTGSRTQRGQHYGSLNGYQTYHLGSPPPPYAVSTPPPSGPPRNPSHNEERASSSDETASLVNGNRVRRRSKARIVRIAILVFFVIMLTVLFSTTLVLSVAIKREWTEWQRVHDDIQHLRIQHEEERREWEREREERRRGHMPFWGEARLLTEECPEDRIRQYDALMHNLLVEDDWDAACTNTAIDIAGRRLASPRTCINYGLDVGVRGYWSIEVNSSEC